MSDLLGPHGKATIVLMRSHFESELPKLKDLKKLLNIPDGKYYKSSGRNYHEVNMLERVLIILNEARGEKSDFHKSRSTDYLVTVAEVQPNLFLTLKYTAQVIDGFNLTDTALKQLSELISGYNEICSMREDITRMWDVLIRNSQRATEKGFEDKTILNPDVPGLQKILNQYGDDQYAQITQSFQDWYETYRWKYKSTSKPEDSNNDDATATEEVA